ncbi:MAG: HD domain-containing protein [Thermoplasmatota archaeon]
MKTQFVSDLGEGDMVNSMFAVKFTKPPKEYRDTGKDGAWFELRLSDKTGEISAKYWGDDAGYTHQLFRSVEKGDVVFIRGRVVTYRQKREITIEKGGLRTCQRDEYDPADYVEVADQDTDVLMAELMDLVDSVGGPYRELLDAFFRDDLFAEAFAAAPAAMHRHQNYIGGLLVHTLHVARICERVHELFPSLDRDLMLTGAILHDIGKIREFAVETSIDISEEGMLLGHIPIGAQMVRDRLRETAMPERETLKVLHIILSHHGRQEYGSPKEPQFPEAYAVYYADELDAKVDYARMTKENAETEDLWLWKRDIGHIYLK